MIFENLSAILVLSYFLIHNIFLVQIGIIFSLCLININFLNKLFRSINKNFIIKKSAIELKKDDNIKDSNSMIIDAKHEDTKNTFVETIEELGFIPSINKNDETLLNR